MEEVIELIRESIQDNALSRGEKRELKALIQEKQFSKRELDFLRSQIFDLAKEKVNEVSPESLIDWVERTNKLTLYTSNASQETLSEAHFSPGTACKSAIINQLRIARSSIKICVFTISDNDISDEIIKSFRRKVDVKIITDNDKSFDRGSDIELLSNKGIPIKIDQTDNHMHHKFCIIDKQLTLTGSYNWTRSAASYNQENILLTKEPSIAKQFLGEFEKLWSQLKVY